MAHPIFRDIQRGRFQDGLDFYTRIDHPTPDDHRWAGYCFFALDQLLPARDLLRRAVAEGCHAAGLELSLVLRYLGEHDEAARQLAAVPLDLLSPLDRVYAQREHAATQLEAGEPRAACQTLERAWADLLTLGDAGLPLRTGVSQLLGASHALLGRTARATYYLDQALDQAQGARRIVSLHLRAQVRLYAGQITPARQDLHDAGMLLETLPGERAYHAYTLGLIERSQGQWDAAVTAFAQGARLAQDGSDPGTEALCELGQATTWTVRNEIDRADAHLSRASALPASPWLMALIKLRRGSWLAVQGERAQAVELLEEARATFETLGTLREQAWAELHLAAAQLPDMPAARRHLAQAARLRHALGSGAALLPELRLLPALGVFLTHLSAGDPLAVFLVDRQAIHCVTPLALRLQTLGGSRLLVDGQPKRLGMRRTLELLSLLALRGPQSRSAILTALWADDDPRRATNYLHQCRKELAETVPGLQVAHERGSGLYRLLSSDAPLSCDALEVQRALRSGREDEQVRAIREYGGAFLVESGSDWAGEEREGLEWSVVKTGLELMGRWSAAGEYEKCESLAQRLLEIAPSDEGLVEYLVQAVFQLRGSAAAQRTLHELALRASREIDELPAWHTRLSRTLVMN